MSAPADIPDLWSYAQHFTLDDHFFSTIAGPSFPNHLTLLAGTSANVVDDPIAKSQEGWECRTSPSGLVSAVIPGTDRYHLVRPCFAIPTLPTVMESRNISWAYYMLHASGHGAAWNASATVPSNENAPFWRHLKEESSFIQDAQAGTLPAASWVRAFPPLLIRSPRHQHRTRPQSQSAPARASSPGREEVSLPSACQVREAEGLYSGLSDEWGWNYGVSS